MYNYAMHTLSTLVKREVDIISTNTFILTSIYEQVKNYATGIDGVVHEIALQKYILFAWLIMKYIRDNL